ncbi:MAG: hypothetical protein FJ149_01725 [Euryarchaeota archaeon]|nr:hypothetical protein [Euryarchaeota archaeon]
MALSAWPLRLWSGMALSASGLAGAFAGLYWDALRGAGFSAGDIGAMQWLAIAGGVALCAAGVALMLLPRREGKARGPVKVVRMVRAAKRSGPPAKRKKRPAGKRARDGRGR